MCQVVAPEELTDRTGFHPPLVELLDEGIDPLHLFIGEMNGNPGYKYLKKNPLYRL